MIYMLDTNIVIYFIKDRPKSVALRINSLNASDDLCMSYVTYSELLKGAESSTKKTKVLERLDALTGVVPVKLPSSLAICQKYSDQSTRLKRLGTPVGGNDLWIACHALAEDAVLVTNNTREFIRIEGLPLENWAEE